MKLNFSLLLAFVFPSFVVAQLSGTVGPLTTRAAKAATKICNILSYGGVASATTDNSAAITAAWAACINGGEGWDLVLCRLPQLTFKVYIPSGSYGLSTWITLTGGSAISINLEGTIYRTGYVHSLALPRWGLSN
jgi:rhamnogalacturonan hydrolase